MIKATDMLFLQVLLFFLFSIPAFALFGQPTANKGPVFVVADHSVRGYWYRDDSVQPIRYVMHIMGVENSNRIFLGKVKTTSATKDPHLQPELMKPLTYETFDDAKGEWRRYSPVSANLLKCDNLSSRLTCIAFTA